MLWSRKPLSIFPNNQHELAFNEFSCTATAWPNNFQKLCPLLLRSLTGTWEAAAGICLLGYSITGRCFGFSTKQFTSLQAEQAAVRNDRNEDNEPTSSLLKTEKKPNPNKSRKTTSMT